MPRQYTRSAPTDPKQCSKCYVWKPLTDFNSAYSRTNPALVRSCCNTCQLKRQRAWTLNNEHAKTIEERRPAGTKPSQRYALLRSITKKRGIECDISRDVYLDLLSQPCHYCGFPLNPTGLGLDRKVPGGPYTLANVVPACMDCNMKKHTLFTYEEMLVIGAAIRQVKMARVPSVQPR